MRDVNATTEVSRSTSFSYDQYILYVKLPKRTYIISIFLPHFFLHSLTPKANPNPRAQPPPNPSAALQQGGRERERGVERTFEREGEGKSQGEGKGERGKDHIYDRANAQLLYDELCGKYLKFDYFGANMRSKNNRTVNIPKTLLHIDF